MLERSIEITYLDCINLTLKEAMRLDSSIFLCGVETKVFGSLDGICDEFGEKRCFALPICEEAGLGFALGASTQGLRPVVNHIRVDFLLLAFNQLINMIGPARHSTNGALSVPLVIRAIIGRGWGQGHQHSKSLQGILRQIPGIKVFMPTSPQNVHDVLIYALNASHPTVILEHRWLYWQKGRVTFHSDSPKAIEPSWLNRGSEVTVVSTSWMTVEVMAASHQLKRRNISLDVFDPVDVVDPDLTLIFQSVRKTGLCIIVDNDWQDASFSTWIASKIYDHCNQKIKKPIARIGFAQVPCPTARELEREFYPNSQKILFEIEKLLELPHENMPEELIFTHENRFYGPF